MYTESCAESNKMLIKGTQKWPRYGETYVHGLEDTVKMSTNL